MYTLNPFTINNNIPPSCNTYVMEPKGFMIYPKKGKYIVVTYEIRVFFEGAQKEVFSSIFKKTL